MSSPFDCCVECPKRTMICHAECTTYAEARAVDAAQKAQTRRERTAKQDAVNVLVDSRMRFRRKLHI